MTTHFVTFSDESMSCSAELCVDSALRNGVDRNVPTGPSQRPLTYEWLKETNFYRDNMNILSQSKGCGLWAWKPFVILHAFGQAEENDCVIYSDAGVEFIAPVSHIINRMDQDIFLFGNNWEHAHWCKRDVVDAVYRDHEKPWKLLSPWSYFGKQCQASVIFFRVSDYTRAFVKEWLDWCLYDGGRLIDDSPCQFNHPEFREHRHDQAILTTMAYREGIRLHWWPAMYNDGVFVYEKLPEYAGDDYPVLFHHHRRRNVDWKVVV